MYNFSKEIYEIMFIIASQIHDEDNEHGCSYPCQNCGYGDIQEYCKVAKIRADYNLYFNKIENIKLKNEKLAKALDDILCGYYYLNELTEEVHLTLEKFCEFVETFI